MLVTKETIYTVTNDSDGMDILKKLIRKYGNDYTVSVNKVDELIRISYKESVKVEDI